MGHVVAAVGGHQYFLLADKGFAGNLSWLLRGYKHYAGMPPVNVAINKVLSKLRQPVEWAYGDITNYFSSLSLAAKQRALVSPIGIQYRVAALLTNCIAC